MYQTITNPWRLLTKFKPWWGQHSILNLPSHMCNLAWRFQNISHKFCSRWKSSIGTRATVPTIWRRASGRKWRETWRSPSSLWVMIYHRIPCTYLYVNLPILHLHHLFLLPEWSTLLQVWLIQKNKKGLDDQTLVYGNIFFIQQSTFVYSWC